MHRIHYVVIQATGTEADVLKSDDNAAQRGLGDLIITELTIRNGATRKIQYGFSRLQGELAMLVES